MNKKDTELERIENLVKKGEAVLSTCRPLPSGATGFDRIDSASFSEWRSQSENLLNRLFGPEHSFSKMFQKEVNRSLPSHAKKGIGILKAAYEDYTLIDEAEQASDAFSPVFLLNQIFDRFHLVVRQLRSRHADRESLNVKDEYDVQDLLHSLLWLFFDDIRPEESTPSYAGGSSRMDFLLKKEQIVIETKRSSEKLAAKELANQLIEDIDRYKTHPDCKLLLCFVYDPEGRIPNPRGIENDLSRDGEPFPVRVFIRP